MPFIVQALLALAAVLALAAAIFFVVRRFGSNSVGKPTGRSRQPRLGVIDVANVDSRRRLVIVRRDTVEHLIMIGGPNDVVIEANIVRAQNPAQLREERTTQLSLGDDADTNIAPPPPARPARDLPAAIRPPARHEPVVSPAMSQEAAGDTRRNQPPPEPARPARTAEKAPVEVRPADIRPAARSAPPIARPALPEAPALRSEPRPRPAVAPSLAVATPPLAASGPQITPPPAREPVLTPSAPAQMPLPAPPSIMPALASEAARHVQPPAAEALPPPPVAAPVPAPQAAPLGAAATNPPATPGDPTDLEAEMANILGRLSAPPRT